MANKTNKTKKKKQRRSSGVSRAFSVRVHRIFTLANFCLFLKMPLTARA